MTGDITTYDVPATGPEDLASLRADLTAADFRVDAIEELLGEQAAAALHREHAAPARRRLAQGPRTPLATITSLFTLGETVDAAVVDAAVPRTGAAGLARLGLVVGDASGLRARCDLRPYGDEAHLWWVASDLGELVTGGPLRPDHVLGVGGASATLASWTPRPAVRRALDIGTGGGVQALHLSTHADEVVATDLSRRALGYAAFTAALNGQEWQLRQGSLLEPVAGERFDLIVSNPPFVITPRRDDVPRYEYRDGGGTGDRLVAALVAGVGEHLTDGGIAHLLGNWETGAGQDWRDVWEGWLDGTGLDAFVVTREWQDPCEYAETWARDGGQRPGSPAYDALVAAWLDDFEERGVERIGFGVVTLRRRAGSGAARVPWRDLVEHTGPVAAPMGPSVLARLAARDWLAEHGLSGVLAARWQIAPDVTEERHGVPGAPDPSVILIRQGGGLGTAVRADTVLAAFVGVCDGELTAGQALAGIAALLEAPVADVVAQAWPGVERLIAEGMLVPVS